MTLSEKSLAIKLLGFVGSILILISAGYLIVGYIYLHKAEKEIAEQVNSEIKLQIEQTVAAKSSAIASEVSSIIEKAFQYPATLSKQIGASIEGKLAGSLSREQTEALVSNTLTFAPVSSAYAQFEQNKFDGKDKDFVSGFSHSVKGEGSFEVYFVKEESGVISQEPIELGAEKYDETLDEFGNRAAEWFLCSKEKLKPCIINPYKYEIRPGYTELMTSLVAPVIANGSFRGVVGADLNLPLLQEKATKLKQSLYQGNSSVFIVSQDFFVAAASDQLKSLARPFKEATKNSEAILAHMGKQQGLSLDGQLIFVRQIPISIANENWLLIVGIDENVAMQPVANISNGVKSEIASILTTFFMLGIILTVIALLLFQWFSRSIVKPVDLVASRMQELAGKGGDLTQSLEVSSHEELIRLANAFNQFRIKVCELLEQAKQSGRSVMESSEVSKESAVQTNYQIMLQQKEIDSIVTAITEMSATAHEVASTASSAANNAETATTYVKETEVDVSKATQEVSELSEEMSAATVAVKAVSARSEDIKKILDVIAAIAEQTNLLALNAAIEAARAGDHGRGFSVVADEVRALASKTADSVGEISQVINALQSEVSQTVNLIETGSGKASDAADRSREVFEKMKQTVIQIEAVTEHILQIAAAAEEQSQVSEELSRNMVIVGDATKEVAQLSESSEQSAMEINDSVKHLEALLSKLKTS
ncbi:methyl-accepting chemotaxis protein [Thalassotalea marina]|uniref:Methyl-accepting chemotaxis protein n=1 Tax=Thalassotalea marina TaxID=1673741 RepID=A0A919BJX2_9GAMM|nr:methyl-accepting chemotaxis protein [Thalassotalea marina]GHF92336.1 methyl-accepting chemotaxis protein [Thalassotalea marina]